MKSNTTAHVIIIGDEILYGQTLDTNSHYLANEFAGLSIDLIQISAVQDNKEVIKDEILSSQADIIITTGGLGPTRDDKTKYVLSELMEQPLEMHDEALQWTEEYFERVTERPMNVLNRNQALVPVGTEPLRNKVGTAPGLWTEYGSKILVCLPGVPFEMKYLMKNEVLPRLMRKFKPGYIHHSFVQTINIPESELAVMLHDFEHELPQNISLAYLPRGKKIRLRLTGKDRDKDMIKTSVENETEKLISIIPEENFMHRDSIAINASIAELLRGSDLKVATAESFTAGRLASQLTAVSGSGEWFTSGIIAYTPELKSKLLGVSSEVIEREGVVNNTVALEMAKGALKLSGADVAISSTGVAGPESDEFGVEPGVAFIALVSRNREKVIEYNYPGLERKAFTTKISELALVQLYGFLKEELQ